MADDKLSKILQDTLGNLAKPVMNNFEKNFKSISSSVEARDEIASSLASITNKSEIMFLLDKYANEISERIPGTKIPDDKLHKYLQPILGTTSTISAIRCLEQLNPELIGNEELRDKFIKEINKVPDEDKNYMVAAAIKISKIKEVLSSGNDDFEYAGAYQNFENITTRLLKNFYNIANYARSMINNGTLPEEQIIEAIEGPLGSATSIVFNDRIENTLLPEQADKEIDFVVSGSAAGVDKFPVIVQYIAEKSGRAAEIIFNNKEFRKFSKWDKERIVQNAQNQALSDKKDINVAYVNDKRIER